MNKFIRSMKESKKIINFMDGISFEINPIDTLKMVTASSIFGEPAYYRDGEFAVKGLKDSTYSVSNLFTSYSVLQKDFIGKKTSEIMEEVIDNALDYNFEETIRFALTLRKEYLMRLNPQVIMVRAAIHPIRKEFSKKFPGEFSKINNEVMSRADEPSTQLTYYLYKNKSKNKLPSILKRNWARKLESLSDYEIYKYRNIGIGIIDTVRVCHAKGKYIDELMRTGTVLLDDGSVTWEKLRSSGYSWKEITNKINIPHMALLRNLRGIFEEVDDLEFCNKLMQSLKNGVIHGKQFPFRYWSALKVISNSDVNHKGVIMDSLEECIDISTSNMPKLKGKTMCLSDNSGSAWGAFNSEYGTVTVAEIDNLSSLITAINSDEGYVGKFGDKLVTNSVSKRNGILKQCYEMTKDGYNDVGGSTENGIWIFFDKAIKNKEHYDNIFIYSDQQAGHGGLYGQGNHIKEYKRRGFSVNEKSSYIDVSKLISEYRKIVNPKVNVFSVQTAGYNNVCIPEYGYRTNILYGWTGKELIFAKNMIDFWDEIDNKI